MCFLKLSIKCAIHKSRQPHNFSSSTFVFQALSPEVSHNLNCRNCTFYCFYFSGNTEFFCFKSTSHILKHSFWFSQIIWSPENQFLWTSFFIFLSLDLGVYDMSPCLNLICLYRMDVRRREVKKWFSTILQIMFLKNVKPMNDEKWDKGVSNCIWVAIQYLYLLMLQFSTHFQKNQVYQLYSFI